MDACKALPIGGEAVDYLGPVCGHIAAVAGVIALGDLRAIGQNRQIIPFQPVPHIPVLPCGGREQVVLESEGVAGGGKLQFSQRRFRQEAQRQIGLILEQRRIAEAVDLRKIGALLILPIPLNHIFQVQEQVGHRGAFLKAVAVVGVFRAVAQSLHEQGGLDVGRAGEGGHAVVAVQSAVVQGLGVGGLRPVEQGIFLPLLHVADDGSRLFLSPGVVGNGGAGEVQAEADEIGDYLYPGDRQHQHPGAPPLAAVFQPDPGNFLLLCLLRDGLEDVAGQHRQQIQHQKHQIVDKIQGKIQFSIKKGQFDGFRQLVGAGQHPRRQYPRRQNSPGGEGLPQSPCPVGHVQHHEAVQEAEPIGNHVGKVEAMPDIV